MVREQEFVSQKSLVAGTPLRRSEQKEEDK